MTFDEANEYISSRLSKTTRLSSQGISRTVPAKIRAHCFFSARVADERILERIRRISDAFSRGDINQSEARQQLRSWLKSEGFDTSRHGVAHLASTARVDLILKQNKRMAVAVGKYAADRDPVVEARFPCWKYHAGRNPRSKHKALDGKVFRKNDPIWHKIYPPWEFNCNCWVENCDEDPVPETESPKLIPEPPESGFEFDPMDAFEDFRLDKYNFDNSPPAIVKAASEARRMSDEAKARILDLAPETVKASDDWWASLSRSEREVIKNYTAGDRFQLNLKHRARGKTSPSKELDMTNAASQEMDRLSAILQDAPKYKGVSYRVLAMEKEDEVNDLLNDLDKSIWGLKGFNSTSLTPSGTAAYLDNNRKHKIMLHVYGRNGVYIGDHSWIGSDEEVLFDRKIKFRALKSGETGYIKPVTDANGIIHIAITEV